MLFGWRGRAKLRTRMITMLSLLGRRRSIKINGDGLVKVVWLRRWWRWKME